MERLETTTIETYPLGKLFPEEWKTWIFDIISDDAPFSWGDNDHTLVSVARFRDWFDVSMMSVGLEDPEDKMRKKQVHEKLDQLEAQGAYIELEH